MAHDSTLAQVRRKISPVSEKLVMIDSSEDELSTPEETEVDPETKDCVVSKKLRFSNPKCVQETEWNVSSTPVAEKKTGCDSKSTLSSKPKSSTVSSKPKTSKVSSKRKTSTVCSKPNTSSVSSKPRTVAVSTSSNSFAEHSYSIGSRQEANTSNPKRVKLVHKNKAKELGRLSSISGNSSVNKFFLMEVSQFPNHTCSVCNRILYR